MTTKKCTKCHEVKELEEFHRDSRAADGKTSECKSCKSRFNRENWHRYAAKNAIKKKKWREKNPEEARLLDRKIAARYRESHNEKQRRTMNIKVKGLDDSYIKRMLLVANIPKEQITPELILLKKSIIKIKRYAKKENNKH